MSKKAVLEYVQACLSTMDSDLVDSIDDVAESEQVAELLKETYYDLINRQDWSFLYQPIVLTAAGDTNSPTKFTIPESVRKVEWLSYNVSDDSDFERRVLHYLDPEDFLSKKAVSGSDRQLVTVGQTIEFYVDNDRMPTFWTSFNDVDVYLDSFDSAIETTLTTSRMRGRGIVVPEFEVTDTYVPDIPEHMIPLLQHMLNSSAHLYFKQQQSVVDERKMTSQMSKARRDESKVTGVNYYAFRNGR